MLALFDRTIEALRRGAREFAAMLEAALVEEGDGSCDREEPERCSRWPECDGTCECQRTGWIPPQD